MVTTIVHLYIILELFHMLSPGMQIVTINVQCESVNEWLYKTNPNSTYEITYSCSMVLVEADESVNQLFFGVVCDTVTLVYSV